MKLADRMVRDWRKKPLALSMDSDAGEQLRGAVQKLVPQELRKETVLFVTPLTSAKNIIDATLGARCEACGRECWLAPSSRAVLADANVICLDCIESALEGRP